MQSSVVLSAAISQSRASRIGTRPATLLFVALTMTAAAPMLGDVVMTLPAPLFDFHSPIHPEFRTTADIRHMVSTLIDGDPAEKARMMIEWLRTSPRYLQIAMCRANRRAAAIARRRAAAPIARARRAQAERVRRANRTPQQRNWDIVRARVRAQARRAAAAANNA